MPTQVLQETSHDDSDLHLVDASDAYTVGKLQFRYTFENFFHPFLGKLIEQLNTRSLAGLLDANEQEKWTMSFF